ncbi:MAG: HlyD family efflux transporter periplasmic adaptor subunit [Magnetococcales bacterium]|nr:HlyD family efflux transporter periplasmic adaptor subunit [Magnetococcales bacterium]
MTQSVQHPPVELLERQVQGLTTLLTLQEEARKAESLAQLGFVVVNETLRLVFYAQAIFWRWSASGKVTIAAVSGVPRFDANAPQMVWYQKAIDQVHQAPGFDQIQELPLDRLPKELAVEGESWIHASGLWLPLKHPRTGDVLGGLWLTRDRAWEEGERILLEHLLQGYGESVALWQGKRYSGRQVLKKLREGLWLLLVLVVLLAMFAIDVRQSVLAPARVAAVNPSLVTAPMDGMVAQFFIEPHAAVKKGALLFALDVTELKSRHQLAQEELALAETQLRKVGQLAFSDKEHMAEIATNKNLVREASAKVAYAAELLERAWIHAAVDGIAVFSDPYAWLGRPVRLGEKVLEIAAPEHVEMAMELPAAEAMPLAMGSEVALYLDSDPLRPLAGRLRFAAYEATPSAEGKLVYQLKAELANGHPLPRLGLKGTAKIYGPEVSLFHALFHRPLAALRRMAVL